MFFECKGEEKVKYTLNPYALVINVKGEYNFLLTDYNNPIKLIPNEEQLNLLEQMHQGKYFDYEQLCGYFGCSNIDALVKSGCLIPGDIDTQSLLSRTNAFFLTHNMPEARLRLSSKKVLILGCGGIGTHMAWHMATLGVNQITLVDFDTIEISNLNRQLLFDGNDVGQVKTDVLKSKLSAINPDIHIKIVHQKISSEEELEAICLKDKFDLIIKALDSPAELPIWLDNVSKRNKLTYIAGITMRENVLIGPSYIPGEDSHGWSDLMDIRGNVAEKIYGTAPSIGIMLYHISDELAIESFKILTGYGTPKYKNKILCRNVITDEEYIIQKATMKIENSSIHNKTRQTLLMSIVTMIALTIASTQIAWFIPVTLLMAMVLPYFIYIANQDIVRCTFINATIFSFGLLFRIIGLVDMNTPALLISSLVILFGIHSAITLLLCVVNYFTHKLLTKKSKIKK